MNANCFLLSLFLWAPALQAQAPAGPLPTIFSITFQGNKGIDSNRLKDQLRVSREGRAYRLETLTGEVQDLEGFYHNEGYLHAKVNPPLVETKTAASNKQIAVIRIPILEGPLYVMGELTVKNVQAFRSNTVAQMAPIRAGQPYSRRRLEDWIEKMTESYHTMGYIRFEAKLKEEIHDVRRTVDSVLECNEGNQYHVGKITIVGNEAINLSDFKRHLLVGEGGAFNPEMILVSIQFLNESRAYGSLTESDVEVKIDDTRSTVDLIFHIAPSRRSPS